jgi:DNA adenine methylase
MNKVIKSGLTNSPFRYPGGKFYARKLILQCIPNHEKYCEPFAGGASVFFAKDKIEFNVLNDLDKDLMNCYDYIKNHPKDLVTSLQDIPATKELHSYYKNEFKPKNKLEQAKRYYYLNRTSYSGIMRTQNCYWGYGDKYSMRPENWERHLLQVSERLQGVKLFSLDFEQLFKKLKGNWFLFIDPPYFNADQGKFYNCTFSNEDHIRLMNLLKKYSKQFKFLITYDNCPEIKEMYNWCSELLDKEWNYTINRTDDQKNGKKLKDGFKNERYKGKEIFITNYNPHDIESVSFANLKSDNKQFQLFK